MRLLVSGGTRSFARFSSRWPDRFGRLLTPRNRSSSRFIAEISESQMPWAIDNGAFSGFEPESFRKLLGRCSGRSRLMWVASPDVVGNATATRELFEEWEPLIHGLGLPVAFVLQDGCERMPLPWMRFEAVFIGGSTAWKLSDEAARVARHARLAGKAVHMGRVNSLKRLRHAAAIGCETVDGSAASKFGDKYLPAFARWIGKVKAERTLF